MKSTGVGNVTPRIVVSLSTLRRNILCPSSEIKSKSSKKESAFHISFLANPENGGSMFPRMLRPDDKSVILQKTVLFFYKQCFGASKNLFSENLQDNKGMFFP